MDNRQHFTCQPEKFVIDWREMAGYSEVVLVYLTAGPKPLIRLSLSVNDEFLALENSDSSGRFFHAFMSSLR